MFKIVSPDSFASSMATSKNWRLQQELISPDECVMKKLILIIETTVWRGSSRATILVRKTLKASPYSCGVDRILSELLPLKKEHHKSREPLQGPHQKEFKTFRFDKLFITLSKSRFYHPNGNMSTSTNSRPMTARPVLLHEFILVSILGTKLYHIHFNSNFMVGDPLLYSVPVRENTRPTEPTTTPLKN
jgi:hypothetical protein